MFRRSVLTLFLSTLLPLFGCCSLPALHGCWICEQERQARGQVVYEEYQEPELEAPAFESQDSSDREEDVVILTNGHRVDVGLELLEMDSRLVAAARQHSQEMCDLEYFSHRSPIPEYESLAMRGKLAGITSYRALGENIASTTAPSPEAFVEMWMDSEGHRKNILREAFTHIGVGVVDCGGTTYATQMFVRF